MKDSIYASHTESKRMEVELNEKIIKENTVSSRKGRRNAGRGGSSVTVRRGDTLSAIAKRNHTTVTNLKRLNGIRGNNIRAGQKLRVK